MAFGCELCEQEKWFTKTGNPGFGWEEVKSACIFWAWGFIFITPEDGNKDWSLSQCKQQQKKQQMNNKKATRRAKPSGNPMDMWLGVSSISIYECFASHLISPEWMKMLGRRWFNKNEMLRLWFMLMMPHSLTSEWSLTCLLYYYYYWSILMWVRCDLLVKQLVEVHFPFRTGRIWFYIMIRQSYFYAHMLLVFYNNQMAA